MRRAACCSALRRERPSPRSTSAERRHLALDLEGLRMRLAARGRDAIGRHRQAARLQPFLQFGLGVLAPVVDLGAVDDLAEQAPHHLLRGVETAVQEGRADQRLQRIGQDRRALRAAAARLAVGQAQRPAAGRAPAQHGAGFPRAPGGRARASGRLRQSRKSAGRAGRHGHVEHRVAQELEPLVVLDAESCGASTRAPATQAARRRAPSALLQCVERQRSCHRSEPCRV